jgi:hypothetical protein
MTTPEGTLEPGPIYDTAPKPLGFEFIPLWGFMVFLWYTMRRVDYRRCGEHFPHRFC